MNWKIILLLVCALPGVGRAQLTNSKGWYDDVSKIEDRKIGWMRMLTFATPAKPHTQDGWSYNAKEIEAVQKLTGWFQQSYTPVGLLGEMKQALLMQKITYPPGSSYFDPVEAEKYNRKALPNSYGFRAKLHLCLVKTATAEFAPMPGNHCFQDWHGMINNVELISKQMIYLSGPDEYYCIQPRYSIGIKGEFGQDWRESAANFRNFTTAPALKRFDHYLLPGKTVDNNGDAYVVILTKDDKPLPFEQVTFRDMIDRVEKQLATSEKIYRNTGGTTPDMMTRMRNGVAEMRRQFSDNMNDFVYLQSSTSDIDPLDVAGIEAGRPITWVMATPERKNQYGNVTVGIPLLRLKKGTKELCAAGPQWIVYRLDQPIRGNYGGSINAMDHFINRYNYDYVWNYFFGKEKPAGPYSALNFTSADEANTAKQPAAASAASIAAAADKKVIFFDDFSTTPAGSIPMNWYVVKDFKDGNKPTVIEIPDAPGKWLRLKGNAYPARLNQPITGDFVLSFDVLVKKGDVPWGTPGLQLQLYADGQPNTSSMETSVSSKHSFNIDISPGDAARADAAGWLMIGKRMPDGWFTCKMTNYYSLPALTGSKPVNRTTITLRRKGERVIVLSNNSVVFDCEKAFPPDLSFKYLRFYVNERGTFHIGSLRIAKE